MTREDSKPEPLGRIEKGNGETWRDLAQLIEMEADPAKVLELAQQLIARLDSERGRKS